MKIYGVYDHNRNKDEISTIIAKMCTTLNHGSYSSDNFVTENLGIGHLYTEIMSQDRQPIWNEDRSKFIVMVGKIFDYEKKRKELFERGHDFTYSKSDAEFILHGLEEWGNDLIKELNGVFVFATFDVETGTLTIVNDRYGMKPLYYFHNKSNSNFVFASEVKAIIRDPKVKKEINWDGWHDFFTYRYLLGTKTLFRNIWNLPNATILNSTGNEISLRKYWDYEQISIDHESSEREFIDKGVRLIRQAIERQTEDIKDCNVLLSGGYDSRCIASALRYYTTVNFETFTTLQRHARLYNTKVPSGMIEKILAKEIANCLHVKNNYIQRPSNLYSKYIVEKVFLLDGMALEHSWILPLVGKLENGNVSFDGIAGDVLFNYERIIRHLHLLQKRNDLINVFHDDNILALILHKGMRRYPEDFIEIYEFFDSSVREKLKPKIDSVLKEIKSIGNHENKIIIFHIKNRTKNAVSLCPNNLVSKKTPCRFLFLDKDLVEFSLSIPPMMKITRNMYFKIIRKAFPKVMKIPSTNRQIFTRKTIKETIKETPKRTLFLLLLQTIKSLLFSKSYSLEEMKNCQAEIGYMVNLLKTITIPPFINIRKLKKKTEEYLNNNEDPSCFLIPILEFCIWYNIFYLGKREKTSIDLEKQIID